MKKYAVEFTMACLVLISFFFLSRQAAEVSGDMKDEKKEKQIIAIDPGHGGLKKAQKRNCFTYDKLSVKIYKYFIN